jgi:hypothetical protein
MREVISWTGAILRDRGSESYRDFQQSVQPTITISSFQCLIHFNFSSLALPPLSYNNITSTPRTIRPHHQITLHSASIACNRSHS